PPGSPPGVSRPRPRVARRLPPVATLGIRAPGHGGKETHDGGPSAHQLRAARGDGRTDAGRDGAVQPRGNPAPRELRGPGARARVFLVLRPVMGRDLPA